MSSSKAIAKTVITDLTEENEGQVSNLRAKKGERWKWVVGFRGLYMVSTKGRILSKSRIVNRSGPKGNSVLIKDRMLKPRSCDEYGHLMVALYKNRVRSDLIVHRLVLKTFVGPCPPGMVARHLDGRPANNNVDNLCWGTQTENAQDRIKHGRGSLVTNPKGEEIWWAKLTEDDVRSIRVYSSLKAYSQCQLARMFGVRQSLISRIVRRESWRHVK